MKAAWKDSFAFNKKQRNGIAVLVALIALMVIYLLVTDYFPPSQTPVDFFSFKKDLEKAGIKTFNPHSYQPTAHSDIERSRNIDINSADTALLMSLPKMNSYCAGMIVRYRKKLGGYYSTGQLKEVWGMDSVLYKDIIGKVWADTSLIHKLNINKEDYKELGYHPYIHYYLAKAIVNYREQHGLFKSLTDLHNIVAIDDSAYARIAPYLTVTDH